MLNTPLYHSWHVSVKASNVTARLLKLLKVLSYRWNEQLSAVTPRLRGTLTVPGMCRIVVTAASIKRNAHAAC
jgi:hypothetical protein